MINEKHVRRMTRMAAYEKNSGRTDEKITGYFRGDYLTKQLMITIICGTIAFLILFGCYAVHDFETLINQIYNSDLRIFLLRVLLYYLIFMGIMTGITVAVYGTRYERARRHLDRYYEDLQRMAADYRKES